MDGPRLCLGGPNTVVHIGLCYQHKPIRTTVGPGVAWALGPIIIILLHIVICVEELLL